MTVEVVNVAKTPRTKRGLSLDRISFGLAGLLACAISLADIFGILEIPELRQRFAQLTLLATGLILTTLATIFSAYLDENRRQVSKIEDAINGDARRITDAIHSLDRQLRRSLLEQLPRMVEDVDPALLAIFRPYLEGVFRTPAQIMTSVMSPTIPRSGIFWQNRIASE